jgi:spermidine synthase
MGRILFHREGPTVTVAVRESGQRLRTLVVNGKPDASTLLDMKTQRLVAHLPLALHPDPKEVLVIGLGSGVSAGAVLRHPVRRSTVVELSPEVVEASRYFNPESGAPLDDPRTRLIVTDGRTHIFRTAEKYDVIVSEPTNPWISGVSSLFTREYFERCRDRLTGRGMMAQWLQAYSLPAEDFTSIVRTFRSVFPSATLWKAVAGADYILVGGVGDAALSIENLARAYRLAGVRQECADVEVRDELDLLAHFICGAKGLARIQVDDRLDLEFSAPRHVGLGAPDGLMAVLDHISEPLLEHVAPRPATSRLSEILLRRKRYSAYELLRTGELQPAVDLLAEIERTCYAERIPATFLKGFYIAATNLMQETGALDKAREVLEKLEQRYPGDPEYVAALATLMCRQGETTDGRALFDDILRRLPREPNAHRGLAVLDEARGDLRGALAHYRVLREANPSDPLAAGSIVRLLRALDQHRDADDALRIALRTDPGITAGSLLTPLPPGMAMGVQ